MNKDIGRRVSGEFFAQVFRVRRIGGDDGVRFAGQPLRRFLRRDQPGDLGPITAKKIRASFTGVTATGDEDARSV